MEGKVGGGERLGVVEAADDENRRKGSGERREMRQQPSEQEIGPG